MKRGYIRLSKAGPSLEEQQQALTSAGIDDFSEVYVDELPKRRSGEHLPERALAIRSLVDGDELVIASAARLGPSAADVLAALEAISRKGATIYDVELGEAVSWNPDALKVIAFAQRAESGNRREVAAKMRAKRVATGRLGGAPVKLSPAEEKKAHELWSDLSLTGAQVVEKTGMSLSSLYRRFGERGLPRGGIERKRSKKGGK